MVMPKPVLSAAAAYKRILSGEQFPNGLIVEGHLRFCDDIDKQPLTSLPDFMLVSGALHISGCKHISALPDELIVQDLLVEDSPGITSIGDGLVVMNHAFLDRTVALRDDASICCLMDHSFSITVTDDTVEVKGSIPTATMLRLVGRPLGHLVDHPFLEWRGLKHRLIERIDTPPYETDGSPAVVEMALRPIGDGYSS